MRTQTLFVLIAAGAQMALGASVRDEQLTVQELAQELGLHARKVIFAFDTACYAKADFVRVEGGQAVHSPITTQAARAEIPFYYIFRDVDPQTKSVTIKLGDSALTSSRFKPIASPSARVHEVFPELALPQKPDAQKPIYIFLEWDPETDANLNREMPAEETASKMKRGNYLALYFSETPFAK